jgi:hypothetical protein
MIFWIGVAAAAASAIINFALTKRTLRARLLLLTLGLLGVAITAYKYYNDQQEAAIRAEYWDVSRRNAMGLLGLAGAGLQEHSDINDIIGTYIHPDPGNFQFDCTAAAMNAYSAAIKLEPRFPFSYYYQAGCKRVAACVGKTGSTEWHEDAERARKILLITTQIPGHQENHDQILKLIEEGIPLLRDAARAANGECP